MTVRPSPLAAWWALARPAMLPLLWLAVLFGYGLAHWEWGLRLTAPGRLAGVLAAWTALHTGTLWLNAAVDRDEGAVLFGAPQPVPDRAGLVGGAALVAGALVAALAGAVPALLGAATASLAVLYSHPRTLWKASPVMGPLVNAVGYGVLTPLAGVVVVGAPLTARTVALLAAFALAMLGLSWLAQVGQAQEDAARGYRTLAARAGDAAAATLAMRALSATLGLLALYAALGLVPRLLLLVVPSAWLALRPVGALRRVSDAAPVVRSLLACALVAVALAGADYVRCWRAGLPLAGRCTPVAPGPL